MVTLRRLFGPCRNPDNPDRYTAGTGNPASKMAESLPPVSRDGTASFISRHKEPPPPANVEQHFEKIERQFEQLHDHLQSRPLSSSSQAPPPPSRGSSRPMTGQNPRHIDLLDALFSSHIQNSTTLSPTTPYNEDIAERNMTRFLQTTPPRKRTGVYSRIINALYQEDVADRNIAKGKSGRSWSRNSNARSPPVANNGPSRPKTQGHKLGANGRLGVEKKDGNASRSSSHEDLRSRSRSRSRAEPPASATLERETSNAQQLRPQKSAPNLCAEAGEPQRGPSPGPVGHLGVPPAHKQGDTWSSTPLPESPTLPIPMRRDKSVNENKPLRNAAVAPSPPPRHSPPPLIPRPYSPPASSGTASRKNKRDLSINTELAARGDSSKISHRAIQPPTPSSCDVNHNPTIAQVMNSPLPAGTPTSISPLPSANQKLAEIMDMFKQAYSPTPAISPHPTFETLQDAIVREINSHEAFRRVPLPDQGPPFTPSPTEGSFDGCANVPKSPGQPLNRTISAKESQFSKLMRRGSFKKHRRSSEMRKSISTSVPSKGYDKIFKRTPAPATRRRHTDAPLPSPGFFDTMESSQTQQAAERLDQVTYMDVLLRSANQKRSSKKGSDFGVPKNLGHSHSVGTLSSHGFSEGSSAAAPSVYYMRAQTSASSPDGRHSFAPDDDDDDDVIQLPSVDIPQLQIEGVDENSVQYVGNSTATNAYRLMSWPQKSRTFHPPSSNPGMQQVRGVRSVESY